MKDYDEIRKRYLAGESQRHIARTLGISRNTVARLVSCYGDQLKEETFKEKLSRVPVKVLIRYAKERRGGKRGYAEAMLIEYNKRLKIQLPWDWLYKSKTAIMQSKAAMNQKSEEKDSEEFLAEDITL